MVDMDPLPCASARSHATLTELQQSVAGRAEVARGDNKVEPFSRRSHGGKMPPFWSNSRLPEASEHVRNAVGDMRSFDA